MRRMLLVLAVVVVVLVGLAALVRSVQRRILFPARSAGDASAAKFAVLGGESVWLDTPSARSQAWYLPAYGATGPAPLLIFAHGNGELIDDWGDGFETPRGWGVNVLLVEYPGYGRSGGAPSERSIRAAMIAAYDWATARADVDPKRIVAWGRSLGGGAACALAGGRRIDALVLESSFTDVRSLARRLGLPGFLVFDPFDNLDFVRSYRGPILLVHGIRDAIVPVDQAQKLHAAAPSSELELLDCGHNDCPRPWARVRQFMASHALLPET